MSCQAHCKMLPGLTLLGEVVELLEEGGNVDDETGANEGDALGVDETCRGESISYCAHTAW
jgi:hypothetical protein